MFIKKVVCLEVDMVEVFKEKNWLEVEFVNYIGNNCKNIEEVDIVKMQLVEV